MSNMNIPIELKYEIYHYLSLQELANARYVFVTVDYYIEDYKLTKGVSRYDVKLFVKNRQYEYIEDVIKDGCSFEVVKYMKKDRFMYDGKPMEVALKSGNLEIVKWMYENGFPCGEFSYRTLFDAFRATQNDTNLEYLKWILSKYRQSSNWDLDEIPMGFRYINCKEKLHWIMNEVGRDLDWTKKHVRVNFALALADLDCNPLLEVQKLIKDGLVPEDIKETKYIFLEIVRRGNLEEIKDFLSDGYLYDSRIGKELKNLEQLEWFYNIGFQLDETAYIGAANKGDVSMLNYLNEKQIPCPNEIVEAAIEFGKIEALNWIVDSGYYFAGNDYERYKLAIVHYVEYGKNIQVLEWLYNYGTVLTSELYECAAYMGHLDILKWLKSKAVNFSVNTVICTVGSPNLSNVYLGQITAIINGYKIQKFRNHEDRLDILRWLMKQDFEFKLEYITDAATYLACETRDLEILRWLLRKKWIVNSNLFALGIAVYHGDLKLVRWLYRKGFTLHPCFGQLINKTKKENNITFEIEINIRWLIRKGLLDKN